MWGHGTPRPYEEETKMMTATFDRVRLTWDSFSERERRLLSAMLGVFAVGTFALFVYLAQSGNTALEEESTALRGALSIIASQRERLQQIATERQAAEERYKQTAPPLGSLLEATARDQSIALREVNEEPEKVSGAFKRRGVRASLPGVALTPVMKLMADIDQSEFPVAIEYLQIEHYAVGQDNYTVQLGVVAYDKQGAKKKPAAAAAAEEAVDDEN